MSACDNPRAKILKALRSTGLDRPIFFVWQKVTSPLFKWRAVKFYSQFINPGDLVYDVGANVGNRTKVFLELGATVVAVDPQPSCQVKLQVLFGSNPSVRIVDKGLADSPGTAEMSICENDSGISTLSDKWKSESRFSGKNWAKTHTINLTTLDALVADYGLPAFCKIDVEGFEESVLNGLTKPIACLSIEYTHEFIEDAKRCINRLQAIGLLEFNFSTGETMKLDYQNWKTASELISSLEAAVDNSLYGDIYARKPQTNS